MAVEAVMGPTRRTEFRTHIFVWPPDSSASAGVVAEPGRWSVYEGDQPVAWAFSSREGPLAAELAVETRPAFRRRGYARRAAAAWATAKLAEGKTCFYSYLAGNSPSAALAASLGVAWQFDLAAYA